MMRWRSGDGDLMGPLVQVVPLVQVGWLMKLSHALLIIACAIAGCLFVILARWLLPFFDNHSGTAAWIQAAGALLIIGATAWIANKNSQDAKEREQTAREQLWESIAILACGCLSNLDIFIRGYQLNATDIHGNFLRARRSCDFDVPMEGLAAIPLHQLEDARLIVAVLNLRGAVGQVTRHFDDVETSKSLTRLDLDFVKNQRTPIFNAVASVLRIVRGPAVENEISRLAGNP
jgi:hypothetical protein